MEAEELETGDEGLGSECSSESGSSSHRGLETGVYPSAFACSIDSLPLVLGASYGTTIEVNRREEVRSTWNGAVDLNGSLIPQTKSTRKVTKDEKNYQATNVRYIVYGKAANTASPPAKQHLNDSKKSSLMNGSSPSRKKTRRSKARSENESNGCTSCDVTEPEPFKYINVWRPYTPANTIPNEQNENTNSDEYFCKAITHFAYTPRLYPRRKKVNYCDCILIEEFQFNLIFYYFPHYIVIRFLTSTLLNLSEFMLVVL